MPVQFFYRKNTRIRLSVVKRCLNELLRFSGNQRALLEISFVGPKQIMRLNRTYRGRKAVTDVLSFPLDPEPIAPDAPWHLGEIVIATQVAKMQAKEAGRRLEQQITRLAVHGYVHLQGLDHEAGPKEKKRFENLEKRYFQHLHQKGLMSWDGSLRL